MTIGPRLAGGLAATLLLLAHAAPVQADAAAGAPASGGANANAGAAYTVRLHDLERKVNELKEHVFRSKARLNLLKETVLHGVIAGSRSASRECGSPSANRFAGGGVSWVRPTALAHDSVSGSKADSSRTIANWSATGCPFFRAFGTIRSA